jgi:hypothetical protein
MKGRRTIGRKLASADFRAGYKAGRNGVDLTGIAHVPPMRALRQFVTQVRHGDVRTTTTNSGLPDPECSIGVSFFGKLVSGWTNARMPPSVTSSEGTGLRIKRPQVLTARPSAMVVGTTSNDLYHGRGRRCRRVHRSCVYWNCRSTRRANKTESKCPDCCQNDTHGPFLL